MKSYSNKKLFFLLTLAVLAGCSRQEEKAAEYDWPPPVEGLSWGMSEEEASDVLDWEDGEVIWQEYDDADVFGTGQTRKKRWAEAQTPVVFLEETFTVALGFDEDIGLSYISMMPDDTSEENLVQIQRKLQETYENAWGTCFQELEEEPKEQLNEYLLEKGMTRQQVDALLKNLTDDEEDRIRERPLVSYSVELSSDSFSYGAVIFKGEGAAMLERSECD